MANPKLFRTIDRAVKDYTMIETGDKILLAASGGKDSTALADYLAFRKTRTDFSVTALHISTELENAPLAELEKLFHDWNIELVIKRIGVLARLKPGQKMSCWWCSTQRRVELLNFALEHGYNKIAFGHHLDDILETLLMNALQKGELSTMPPRLKYDKYPVTIIRPLCLADERTIIDHAEKSGYKSITCTCTYQDNSARKKARSKLEELTVGSPALKRRLFEALKNIKQEYLP